MGQLRFAAHPGPRHLHPGAQHSVHGLPDGFVSPQVYVSDAWKFIYIRQPKASSSTMLHAIRSQLCGGTCKPPFFYQEHDKTKLLPKWESYFVFTIVRNPWTRALSAYSMFNRGFLYKYAPFLSHHLTHIPYRNRQLPTQPRWSRLLSLHLVY